MRTRTSTAIWTGRDALYRPLVEAALGHQVGVKATAIDHTAMDLRHQMACSIRRLKLPTAGRYFPDGWIHSPGRGHRLSIFRLGS